MSETEFRFSGKAKAIRVDVQQTKAGKEMVSLIVGTSGQYPQTIAIKAFGKLADVAREVKPGQTVEVTCRVGGREWNGRVFNDVVAEAIEVMDEEKTEQEQPPTPPQNTDDLPF